MKSSSFIFALLFSSLILFSCKKDNNPIPPEDQPHINITLEDSSCTEAWIKLSLNNLNLPASIDLIKDNSLAEIINLTSSDSILYIDSLLPNKTYTFTAQISDHADPVTSTRLPVTTMDTTSHNFTWQTWTFGGQAGSCTLYDVAIIDENDIWAVGEIYIADTSSIGYTTYNAVHWNGVEWKLHRILYLNGFAPMTAIWAFSENDIWFGIGYLIHWDGNSFKEYGLPNWHIRTNKIWGISDNDLYVVGNNGNIAHYQNEQWSRIESGTDLNINDIYGVYDDTTNEWEILAVASDYGLSFDKEILKIGNNEINKLTTYSNPAMEPLLGVWFIPNRQYYVVGSGIYQKHSLNENIWRNNQFEITTYATTSINGNGINDVIAVGAFGDLVHFNGISWKNDYEEPLLSNGSYTRVTMKGNLLVAVGSNYISINSEAIILIGRR